MRKSSLYGIIGLVAALLAGTSSCKKVDAIDNNQGIQTPYSLYFADSAGAVYNTNDGRNFSGAIFRPDGKPVKGICVSGNNVLFAKNNIYISLNNGVDFNHTFDSLALMRSFNCFSTDSVDVNQSMFCNPKDWHRLYSLSQASILAVPNYFGLTFNDRDGIRGYWHHDGNFDTVGDMGALPVRAMGITQTTNGILNIIAYDDRNAPLGTLSGNEYIIRNMWAIKDGDWVRWHERTGNTAGIPGVGGKDLSGTPLPTTAAVKGFYGLGHINNRLIAIDRTCNYGAYYSDDTGKNWLPTTGLPAGVPQMCVESPFEQRCFVGTSGQGLYVYNTNTNSFEKNNKGLGDNLIIRSIVGKENIYKNGTSQKYIYLASNQGIYQSSDGGINWVKTIPGNFTAVY